MPTVEKERVSNYDPNKKMRQRQHDPEHQPVKNRKQLARDTGYGMDDDVVRRSRKKGRQLSAQQMMAPIKIETAYMTAETITVRDLTERIGKPAGEIIKKLMLLGIMATINQELDFDTASLVASEFGVTLEMKARQDRRGRALRRECGGQRGRAGHAPAGRHDHGSRRSRQNVAA